MSDALKLVELQIEEAEDAGNSQALQTLYLRRERLQEKQFRDSLRRRAKAQKAKP